MTQDQDGAAVMVAPPAVARRWWSWKLFALAMVASAIASVLIVPYTIAVLKQMPMKLPANLPPGVFLTIVLIVSGVVNLFLTAAAVLVGLSAGTSIELGAPPLLDWIHGQNDARRRTWRSLRIAAIVGTAAAAAILILAEGLKWTIPPRSTPVMMPPPWQGFLASISAGVQEELWLRFGVLTALAWVIAKAISQPRPGWIILWTANLLAALLFGAIHLPQASALFGGLTAWLTFYVLLLNGVGGLAFGWLYIRHGLIAAIFAHFSADVVLKVVSPLARILWGWAHSS